MNFELRTAIEKAKAERVPLDNIETSYRQRFPAWAGGQLENARYEAYRTGWNGDYY